MLQFISHATPQLSMLEGIRMALAGGCRWVQLRMKEATDDEAMPVAMQVKTLCKEAGATFIIDDRVHLAKTVGADGVHLGKNDMPISEARRILGGNFIIGGTANSIDDVVAHYNSGADYIGCGPFRFTTTKKRLSPILGIEGYKHIMSEMKRLAITIPVVAIGGITLADVHDILETGVSGIAVSGSILTADDPAEETRKFVETIKKHTLWKN